MPLWVIYHPPSTFTTPESKSRLAESITSIYTNPDTTSLPAFYVTVYFVSVPEESIFIGGHQGPYNSTAPTSQDPATRKPFIRFSIDHIAVKIPHDQDVAFRRLTETIDKALKPHVEDRGYDWEYHVTETERRLWKISGRSPPAWGSGGEKRWREEGWAVPLEEGGQTSE